MKRVALAAISGALLSTIFPGPDIGWMAWLALAPLLALAFSSRSVTRSALEGLAFGLMFQGLAFSWWYRLLVNYGRLSHPEAAGVFLLLVGYLAFYVAIFSGLLVFIRIRRGAGIFFLSAPLLWAALEFVRGRLLTGIPWSLLGASQSDFPWAIQAADLGGVTMVSCMVVSGNALIAWGWCRYTANRDPATNLRPPAWPAAALTLAILSGLVYGAVVSGSTTESSGTIKVGLVQGNVAQEEKWAASQRMRILHGHLAATTRVAQEGAALAVWAESSVPLPITSHPAYRELLEQTASREEIDLLVGSVHWSMEEGAGKQVFNSAFLLSSKRDVPAQRYDKMKLVPFGEYVPFRKWLTPVDKLVEEASDFSPGTGPVVMSSAGARLAPLICYEAIFPELARRFVNDGAQLLINITNDAFLGNSAGPRQHLQLAAVRAVENRRWMLRAANTGISAVIDPSGRIVKSLDYGVAGELVHDTPLLSKLSVYTRYGNWFSWGCVILSGLAAIIPRISPGG
jgi:apolipoprotein N-acyltransferase